MAVFDLPTSPRLLTTGPRRVLRRWRRAVRAVAAAETAERRAQPASDVQPIIDRSIATAVRSVFEQEVEQKLETGLDPLLKAYRGLLDAETRGLGRIAGSTPNVLAELVASRLPATAA